MSSTQRRFSPQTFTPFQESVIGMYYNTVQNQNTWGLLVLRVSPIQAFGHETS
ncbi:MAG: hypothetical protein ACTMUP_00620 [cyanobacterium endosymbiont of Rhopalodia musculus]